MKWANVGHTRRSLMQADTPPSTAPTPKRRLTPAAREQFRQELVDIARRIFLSEGYAAVTIRRITAEAGVTPMAFYWYFDCKEALLIVIWDEIIEEAARTCQAHSQSVPMAERAVAYCEAMIDHWLAHRDHFRFIFIGDSPNVDMVQLRQQLQSMPGTRMLYEDLDTLLRWHAPVGTPKAEFDADYLRIRALLTYRVFGFLHSVIGMRQTTPELLALQKGWVLADLKSTLERWRLSSES